LISQAIFTHFLTVFKEIYGNIVLLFQFLAIVSIIVCKIWSGRLTLFGQHYSFDKSVVLICTSSFNAHSATMIMFFLLHFSEIVAIVVSSRKKGSALVEFETNEAAVSIAVIFPTGLHDFSA
jgi:hypothetical protein